MSPSRFAHHAPEPWRDLEGSPEVKERFDAYMADYLTFLGSCKTERETCRWMADALRAAGFERLEQGLVDRGYTEVADPGSSYFRVNRGKALAAIRFGERPLSEGIRLVVAHTDAPRLDLKKHAFYQTDRFAYAKSHYYGLIQKYQWLTIPLALHGRFVLADGTPLELVIGEKEGDPVFTITDLAPHLAKKRADRPLGEVIQGEGLNLLMGNRPSPDQAAHDAVRCTILDLFGEVHGLRERDFFSADVEMVPATAPREVGLDRSMIGGYGQDDRACCHAAYRAMLAVDVPRFTTVMFFFDMEETGSEGPTGAKSSFTFQVMGDILRLAGDEAMGRDDQAIRRLLSRSPVLSADTGMAYDPGFPEAFDPMNSARLGGGVIISKYGGANGKSGSMETGAEYMTAILKLFDRRDVRWQLTEHGRIDEGSASTVAKFFGQYDMDVVDCGTPVASLHSPFEVCSKIDLWNTYRAYEAFLAGKLYNNYAEEDV